VSPPRRHPARLPQRPEVSVWYRPRNRPQGQPGTAL